MVGYIFLSVLIVWILGFLLYYYDKYIEYRNTLNDENKRLKNILFDENINSDEKIKLIKDDYENISF